MKALVLLVAALVVGCSGVGVDPNDFDPPDVSQHCIDGARDVDEVAVDCGGIDCPGCPVETPCTDDYDCASSYCYDFGTGPTCIEPEQAPPCENRVRDNDETDIDCGGTCVPCASGRYCATVDDCKNNECVPVANHPTGTAGQCWDDDYSGCTPVSYAGNVCGDRVLVMCQWHLPSAMLGHCGMPETLPFVTTANLICCDASLF